jgi:hypothetical protein
MVQGQPRQKHKTLPEKENKKKLTKKKQKEWTMAQVVEALSSSLGATRVGTFLLDCLLEHGYTERL